MKPQNPKISIITVTWNDFDNTSVLIESIIGCQYKDWEIIIVDNGSEDNSVEMLKKRYPGITYIINESNLGFSRAYNIGISEALERDNEIIFIVNNDVIIHKDSLHVLLDTINKNDDTGIVCGKIFYTEGDSIIWSAGGKINWFSVSFGGRGFAEKDVGQFNKFDKVDYVPGAAFMIRSSVMKDVGLLPECYFLGGEEVDYSLQVKRKGYNCFYNPNAVFWHKVGYSGKVSDLHVYNRIRNRLLFVDRNYKYCSAPWMFAYRIRHIIKKYYSILLRDKTRIRNCHIRGKALYDHSKSNMVHESDLLNITSYLDNVT